MQEASKEECLICQVFGHLHGKLFPWLITPEDLMYQDSATDKQFINNPSDKVGPPRMLGTEVLHLPSADFSLS